MPRTRLDIWSGAFGAMVGGRLTTTALDSEGDPLDDAAQPIAAVYPSIVDDALLIEAWPWTLARVALSNRDEVDGYPERYRYTMPAAILDPQGQAVPDRERLSVGPRALYDSADVSEVTVQGWRLEGEYVFSDAEALWGEFQFKSPETTWPVQFAEYVRLRLIAETVPVYRADDGVQQAALYARKAEEKLGQVIDSVQQVEPPAVLFDRFQTTAARAGDYLRPIALNADGRAAG